MLGLFDRRDSAWAANSIRNFPAMIEKGDTAAIALFEDYQKIEHPVFESLQEEDLTELMAYLRAVDDLYD